MAPGVSGLFQYVVQERGQALDFAGRCSLRNACADMNSGLADELVQTDCSGLPEVHRWVANVFVLLHGDSQEPVAVT